MVDSATVPPPTDEKREELGALCRRFGVHRLELLGSAAAGRFKEGKSDFDFRVKLGGATPRSAAHGQSGREFTGGERAST